MFFRFAAPEGFSLWTADPAYTIPGSLAAEETVTRFHHRFYEF